MNLHQVVIVPALGHTSDAGTFDQGRTSGRVSEVDVIDGYLHPLLDELDIEDIRWTMIDTRSRPGVKVSERHLKVEPNSLVLSLGCGWMKGPSRAVRNHSSVYFAQETSSQLADELAEALGQWGHCYAHGHRTSLKKATDEKLLSVPETRAVAIEPFILNGPSAEVYLTRLPELGVTLARAVADFLKARSQAVRVSKVRISP